MWRVTVTSMDRYLYSVYECGIALLCFVVPLFFLSLNKISDFSNCVGFLSNLVDGLHGNQNNQTQQTDVNETK